jgi:hypothetical protein
MTALVKAFRCRPITDAPRLGGPAYETFKGGNRENGRWVGAAIVPQGYGDLTVADREAEFWQHDRLRLSRRLGGRIDPDSRVRLDQFGATCTPAGSGTVDAPRKKDTGPALLRQLQHASPPLTMRRAIEDA